MGMSKSIDRAKGTARREGWTAGALVYSGRADPLWTLRARDAREVERVWAELPVWEGQPPAPPPLGYRGSFVRGPGGREWSAYGGAVTLQSPEGSATRRDPERAFERLVLRLAPRGVLPASPLLPEKDR
jgi:hypothetical protein